MGGAIVVGAAVAGAASLYIVRRRRAVRGAHTRLNLASPKVAFWLLFGLGNIVWFSWLLRAQPMPLHQWTDFGFVILVWAAPTGAMLLFVAGACSLFDPTELIPWGMRGDPQHEAPGERDGYYWSVGWRLLLVLGVFAVLFGLHVEQTLGR